MTPADKAREYVQFNCARTNGREVKIACYLAGHAAGLETAKELAEALEHARWLVDGMLQSYCLATKKPYVPEEYIARFKRIDAALAKYRLNVKRGV
jgi:hypothetical protein